MAISTSAVSSNRQKTLFQTNPQIFHSNRELFSLDLADETTPPIVECSYCGATLATWAFGWNGQMVWRQEPERCECSESKAYWQIIDRDREQELAAVAELRRLAEQQARTERLLFHSGLQDRYPGYRLDSWVNDHEARDKAIRNARYYVEHFPAYRTKGTGLYISGDNERGKTHLAAGIAFELVQKEVPVIMTSFGDLLSQLRSTFSQDTGTEAALMDRLASVDLLVIDDLGKEKPTEWSLERLFSLIDSRVSRKLPTIVTTNYTDDELLWRLSVRDASGTVHNDPKTAKAIIARLHRTCINLSANWPRWSGSP